MHVVIVLFYYTFIIHLTSFQKIHDPFLLAVKESLGDRFSISLENTYRIVIRYIISTMVKALGEKMGSDKTLHLDDIIRDEDENIPRKPIQSSVTRLNIQGNGGRELGENEKEALALTSGHTDGRNSVCTIQSTVSMGGAT